MQLMQAPTRAHPPVLWAIFDVLWVTFDDTSNRAVTTIMSRPVALVVLGNISDSPVATPAVDSVGGYMTSASSEVRDNVTSGSSDDWRTSSPIVHQGRAPSIGTSSPKRTGESCLRRGSVSLTTSRDRRQIPSVRTRVLTILLFFLPFGVIHGPFGHCYIHGGERGGE